MQPHRCACPVDTHPALLDLWYVLSCPQMLRDHPEVLEELEGEAQGCGRSSFAACLQLLQKACKVSNAAQWADGS